jgi:hypothetical protein
MQTKHKQRFAMAYSKTPFWLFVGCSNFPGPKEGLQQKVDVWACSLIRQEMQVRRKNLLLSASSLLVERFGISSSRCLHIHIWKNLSRNAEKFAEFLVDRMSATVIMD